MKYSFGLNEEFHKAVVELVETHFIDKQIHFDKTCTEPAEASVTALWEIIAKNELIELTLFTK